MSQQTTKSRPTFDAPDGSKKGPAMHYPMSTQPNCQEAFDPQASRAVDAYLAEVEPVTAAPVVLPDLSMLEIALLHAGRGYKVFPVAWIVRDGCSCWRGAECPSPGKHPLHKGWQDKATSEPSEVARLWASSPQANIGIFTDGLLVLDVDPRHGGAESLATLELEYGALETLTAITGSGGMHYVFTLPAGLRCKNRVSFAPGLDTRADGGFIVAAGSWHASGGRYRWQSRYHEPSEAPAWLIALASPPEPVREAPRERPAGLEESTLSRWGAKAMWYELQALQQVGEGRRFVELHRSAFRIGQLVGGGAVAYNDAEWSLHNAALAMGLGLRESTRAIEHGLRDGQDHPRYPRPKARTATPKPASEPGEAGRPAERQERAGVELSAGAAHVYDLLLASLEVCDPGGTPACRLTVGAMAEQLQRDPRTIRSYLAELKTAGLVERRQTLHGCETTILSGAPSDDDKPAGGPNWEPDWERQDILAELEHGPIEDDDDNGQSFMQAAADADEDPASMADHNLPPMLDNTKINISAPRSSIARDNNFRHAPPAQPAPSARQASQSRAAEAYQAYQQQLEADADPYKHTTALFFAGLEQWSRALDVAGKIGDADLRRETIAEVDALRDEVEQPARPLPAAPPEIALAATLAAAIALADAWRRSVLLAGDDIPFATALSWLHRQRADKARELAAGLANATAAGIVEHLADRWCDSIARAA